jgi:undecaprenyl diphosphate synthase
MAVRGILGRQRREYTAPEPHPSGATAPKLPGELIPKHVAIVMDGNGRWAKERGLPRTEGHKVGAERVLDVLQGGVEMGVGAISLYAFSTENWKRSPDEVRFLMNFNRTILRDRREELNDLGVRVRFSGRRDWRVPKRLIAEQDETIELTKGNRRMTLTFAFNYGGRAEIVDAVRALVAGGATAGDIDEKAIRRHLYDPEMPDPDLVIRTSGEYRISNFLLWELAYSELVFSEVLWPDFRRHHLAEAIGEFQRRDRRYGGIDG